MAGLQEIQYYTHPPIHPTIQLKQSKAKLPKSQLSIYRYIYLPTYLVTH